MTIYNKMAALTGEPAPNFDPKTGCHYGVISQNRLNPYALEEIYQNGVDTHYLAALEDFKAAVEDALPHGEGEVKRVVGECLFDRRNTTAAIEGFFLLRRDRSEEEDEEELIDLMEVLADEFGQQWESDGDGGGYRYEAEGYVITTDSHGDLFVIRSPYFTLTRECSPCAPNAGHLENTEGGYLKTYCLDAGWFEKEQAPYSIYSVETGRRISLNEPDDND